MNAQTAAIPAVPARSAQASAMSILFALSFCHMLNDIVQALLPAVYPILKDSFGLTFTQIGLITLTFQMTGSVLQPLIGYYTDKHPKPYSLVLGMAFTLCGLVLLALAHHYYLILLSAALIGSGSAIFHPESSRMARLASGGRHGFAQSLFQVGGNAGTAIGPLLAAWIIVPHGQTSILVFTVIAILGMIILTRVGHWYVLHLAERHARGAGAATRIAGFPRKTVVLSMSVLFVLMFSKFFYLASMVNYYTFFMMEKFSVSVQQSQIYLFLFLGAGALGTIIGGPVGDRIGRKTVIWISILGMAPFSLLLPHAGLWGTALLSVAVGFVMASAFPAILVYATELLPGKVGLVAGLFFGLSFGLAGIGSALLGWLADATSIGFVMNVCAWLPLLGLLTVFLPNVKHREAH